MLGGFRFLNKCIENPANSKIVYMLFTSSCMEYVQKFQDSLPVWDPPAFFCSKVSNMCLCGRSIYVALDDNTLHSIDTISGCITGPAIYLSGRTLFLSSFQDSLLLIITEESEFTLYDLKPLSKPRALISENIPFPIEKFVGADITFEIDTNEASPILNFESISVRFSMSRHSWIPSTFKLPSIFSPPSYFDTKFSAERAFSEALIESNPELFRRSIKSLVEFLARGGTDEGVSSLKESILSLSEEGVDVYCGVPLSEIYSIIKSGLSARTEMEDLEFDKEAEASSMKSKKLGLFAQPNGLCLSAKNSACPRSASLAPLHTIEFEVEVPYFSCIPIKWPPS